MLPVLLVAWQPLDDVDMLDANGPIVNLAGDWQSDGARCTVTLPEDLPNGSVLEFVSPRDSVEVSVDDWTIYAASESGAVTAVLWVPLPDGSAGKTLMVTGQDNAAARLARLNAASSVGSGAALQRRLFADNFYALVFFLFALITAGFLAYVSFRSWHRKLGETTYSVGSPVVQYEVDREKVKNLGIQLSDVFTAMQVNYGGYQVNDFNRFGRSYKVMLQADNDYRSSTDQMKFIFVKSSKGTMVPLDTLLRPKLTSGPSSISRFNGTRSIQITGQTGNGYSSGQAMNAIKEVVQANAGTGFNIEWSGQSREEQKSGSSTMKVLGLALVFAFLCLAALYESWSVPLAVLFTVPTGIFGAVFSEYVVNKLAALLGSTSDGYQNSVYMQIGIIMIIGLAAKNAILIVEFAKERVDHGMDPVDAVKEAAKLRFRPILMTAFTSIIGCLPLALATGAGAAARCGMGVAVVGGMCFATVFGIFLIPCFYLVTMVIARGLRSVAKGRGSGF